MNRTLTLCVVLTITVAAAGAAIYKTAPVKPPAVRTIAPVHSSDFARAGREQELESLEHDLKQNPAHVPILMRLAQVSREAGKMDKSAEYLRQAVAGDPKNADALLELGRVLFEIGDVPGSIRETTRLLDTNPTSVDALYNLGAIYGNLGQDDRARQYWNRAIGVAPDSESGRRAATGLQQLSVPR